MLGIIEGTKKTLLDCYLVFIKVENAKCLVAFHMGLIWEWQEKHSWSSSKILAESIRQWWHLDKAHFYVWSLWSLNFPGEAIPVKPGFPKIYQTYLGPLMLPQGHVLGKTKQQQHHTRKKKNTKNPTATTNKKPAPNLKNVSCSY